MFNTIPSTESRWLSVAFLQAEDADRVIGVIRHSGPAAGIDYLRRWDHGDESTEAALTDGYVYEGIPSGKNDRTFVQPRSPYALTYSQSHRYVSLLRRYPAQPAPTPRALVNSPSRSGHPVVDAWGSVERRPVGQARHKVAM
jgi:hypothetical protein